MIAASAMRAPCQPRALPTIALVLLSLLALLSACGKQPTATVQELRFSVIPDFNKAKLAQSAALLAERLSRELGVPVRYEPANDYAAVCNGLVAGKLDFAWLGGKTTVDALDLGKGQVHVLAARDIDLRFKSYFIAHRQLLDSGKLKPLSDLRELRAVASEFSFTFGDVNSTSGHLMPRHFLVAAGIDPDGGFRNTGYQLAGGHGATLQAVASGACDLGALNFATWDNASAQDRANAPVIFTTEPYVDYSWVGHARIGQDLLHKLTQVLLALDRKQPEDALLLDAWSAKERFVPAEAKLWDSIRQVRDSLPKGFLK